MLITATNWSWPKSWLKKHEVNDSIIGTHGGAEFLVVSTFSVNDLRLNPTIEHGKENRGRVRCHRLIKHHRRKEFSIIRSLWSWIGGCTFIISWSDNQILQCCSIILFCKTVDSVHDGCYKSFQVNSPRKNILRVIWTTKSDKQSMVSSVTPSHAMISFWMDWGTTVV